MGKRSVSVKVNTPKVSKYTVKGDTLAEVRKNLDKREEWGLYDATPNFKSGAKVDPQGQIASVTIELNPVIELPTWAGYSKATKPQKASWDAMLKKLSAHEYKHHDIQVAGAAALKKAIESAKELDADALNALIEQAQTDTQKAQDSYDRSSGHGAKEGVELDEDA